MIARTSCTARLTSPSKPVILMVPVSREISKRAPESASSFWMVCPPLPMKIDGLLDPMGMVTVRGSSADGAAVSEASSFPLASCLDTEVHSSVDAAPAAGVAAAAASSFFLLFFFFLVVVAAARIFLDCWLACIPRRRAASALMSSSSSSLSSSVTTGAAFLGGVVGGFLVGAVAGSVVAAFAFFFIFFFLFFAALAAAAAAFSSADGAGTGTGAALSWTGIDLLLVFLAGDAGASSTFAFLGIIRAMMPTTRTAVTARATFFFSGSASMSLMADITP
mmetsp:Transcript_19304/g.27932  ORF Transcript_19304/g.27932 Transcript_19304/m.27932 type:complete len:278 (-) Transcript_19304:118-951(-)